MLVTTVHAHSSTSLRFICCIMMLHNDTLVLLGCTGANYPMVINGTKRNIKSKEGPDLYCQATDAERDKHFTDYLRMVGIKDYTTVPALLQVLGPKSRHYNEHMTNQLHWLQDYNHAEYGRVYVLE